jgi:hypothetical protein
MTSIPANIAAEQALTRQNIALSVIKQSNDQQQAIVGILQEAAQNSPISGASRGGNVNTSA